MPIFRSIITRHNIHPGNSLYHHSYRATLHEVEARSRKLRQLQQLSELHYVKATHLFVQLSMLAQAFRTVLERAGLLEVGVNIGRKRGSKMVVLSRK